jgi:two-component system OmpR family response regulator
LESAIAGHELDDQWPEEVLGCVLIAEGDPGVASALSCALSAAGYEVESVSDGPSALDLLRRESYDVALLDLDLPEIDGVSVLICLRALGVNRNVVVLSASSNLLTKVECFEAGASDYVSKPFVVEEVLARVAARTRKRKGRAVTPVLESGALRLDLYRRVALLNGSKIWLSRCEANLLEYMMRKGGFCTRQELLEFGWPQTADTDANILATNIYRLRVKLGKAVIQTGYGKGYRVSAQPDYTAVAAAVPDPATSSAAAA